MEDVDLGASPEYLVPGPVHPEVSVDAREHMDLTHDDASPSDNQLTHDSASPLSSPAAAASPTTTAPEYVVEKEKDRGLKDHPRLQRLRGSLQRRVTPVARAEGPTAGDDATTPTTTPKSKASKMFRMLSGSRSTRASLESRSSEVHTTNTKAAASSTNNPASCELLGHTSRIRPQDEQLLLQRVPEAAARAIHRGEYIRIQLSSDSSSPAWFARVSVEAESPLTADVLALAGPFVGPELLEAVVYCVPREQVPLEILADEEVDTTSSEEEELESPSEGGDAWARDSQCSVTSSDRSSISNHEYDEYVDAYSNAADHVPRVNAARERAATFIDKYKSGRHGVQIRSPKPMRLSDEIAPSTSAVTATRQRLAAASQASKEKLITAKKASQEKIAIARQKSKQTLESASQASKETWAAVSQVSKQKLVSASATSKEKLASASQKSKEKLVSASQTSKEKLASASQVSKEKIVSASQVSKEKFASASQVSKEKLASASQVSKEKLASASQISKEKFASASQVSKEKIANAAITSKAKLSSVGQVSKQKMVQWRSSMKASPIQRGSSPSSLNQGSSILSAECRGDEESFIPEDRWRKIEIDDTGTPTESRLSVSDASEEEQLREELQHC